MKEIDRQYPEIVFFGSRRLKSWMSRQGVRVGRKRGSAPDGTHGVTGQPTASSHQSEGKGATDLSLSVEERQYHGTK